MKKIFAIVFLLAFGLSIRAQEENITPDRKAEIDKLALEKVNDLSKYISIVGNKETPWSEANRVIDRALELFMDGSEIGVSSLSKEDVIYYTIKKYLYRLVALNYDKVEITWYDIQYVSDLKRQPDGKYVGVITVFQKFIGTTKEGLEYKDVTQKDITVYVERKQTQIGGRLIGFWDVLLGDIRVKETKKL